MGAASDPQTWAFYGGPGALRLPNSRGRTF